MTQHHGRIVTVTERPLGSTLVGATVAGATTLTVVDAAEFDDRAGGWLSVNDQVIQYATVDDDTGVVTLTSGTTLSTAADEGDGVFVFDSMYQTIAVDKRADVILDGDDDNTDAIDAGIALHLVDKIDTGVRGDAGESVILEEDNGDWKIIDVLGLGSPTATGLQFDEDAFQVTVAGAQTLNLAHEPVNHSEHLYWHPGGGAGIYQPASEWSRDGQTITVPDAAGLVAVGDRFVVEYAYRMGPTDPGLYVPFGHSWKYAFNLGSDTGYAATTFDDSAWASGPSPFGRGDISWPGTTPADPPPATATPTNAPMNMWMRTTGTSTGGDLTFSAPRVDDTIDVYVDGTLVWHQDFTDTPVARTVSVSSGDHVFAIYGYGQGGTTANTGEYFGVTIREES